MKKYNFENLKIPNNFEWLNKPKAYSFKNGINLTTRKNTDFWQKTHYGFQSDDGHCLLTKLTNDFSIETKVSFTAKNKYDQAGLIVRIDENNWIKCSTEYEDNTTSRLGSVVTNEGYSDWATTDISSNITTMFYKISKRGCDFLIENSYDGKEWSQIRITHLKNAANFLYAGIYTCSPLGEDFLSNFHYITLDKNSWLYI
jgi:uncharacterized protein